MTTLADAQHYFGDRLIKKIPNKEVDSLLSSKTSSFLHIVGLPNDLDNDFQFDQNLEKTSEKTSDQFVKIGLWGPETAICLDLFDNEAVVYSSNLDQGTEFLNSGVKEFTLCLYTLELYLTQLQDTPGFGNIHGPNAEQSRIKGSAYLQSNFMAIDPFIFERGYYWASFIEQIGVGGL